VRRAIPGYQWVHPEAHPNLFGAAKAQERRKLAHQLERSGWQNVEFRDTKGMLIVYGQCLRDPGVLCGAIKGQYDLYLKPPNLGDKTT